MACRTSFRAVLLTLALLLPACLMGQNSTTLRVRLTYSDGTSFEAPEGTAGVDANIRSSGSGAPVRGNLTAMQIHVQLQDSYGESLSEKSPDATGRVEFELAGNTRNVMSKDTGTFRLRVYGANIEEVNLEGIDPYRGDRMLDVTLHRKGESKTMSKTSTVAVSRLQIPDKARKELEKGNESLQGLDYPVAEKHFRKAIEFFPEFDQAHNNLGVILMQTNRPDEARQEFQKAVADNDKFARAYINLGKLDLLEKKYEDGDRELRKAVQADPKNAEALMLACQSALYTNKFEDVIADAKLVHSMPHERFALVHLFAGHAYEATHRNAEAAEEFRLFIKESPDSPNLKTAQDSLARVSRN